MEVLLAECSRGKAMTRASTGFPSILIDVWTVKAKEFYFSGLTLKNIKIKKSKEKEKKKKKRTK